MPTLPLCHMLDKLKFLGVQVFVLNFSNNTRWSGYVSKSAAMFSVLEVTGVRLVRE